MDSIQALFSYGHVTFLFIAFIFLATRRPAQTYYFHPAHENSRRRNPLKPPTTVSSSYVLRTHTTQKHNNLTLYNYLYRATNKSYCCSNKGY